MATRLGCNITTSFIMHLNAALIYVSQSETLSPIINDVTYHITCFKEFHCSTNSFKSDSVSIFFKNDINISHICKLILLN